MRRNELIAGGLLALGLAQMLSDAAGLRSLKAVAAATGASPAPKVFCSSGALETFTTRYFVEWTTGSGAARSVELTPLLYARFGGPYNRRNAYGAALAYGPVLAADPRTRPMLRSVIDFALTGEAPLLREIGLDATDRRGPIRVRFEPREGTSVPGLPLVLEASR